jgi:hypothetical protein
MEKPISLSEAKTCFFRKRRDKRQIRPAEGKSGVNIKPSSLISSLRKC